MDFLEVARQRFVERNGRVPTAAEEQWTFNHLQARTANVWSFDACLGSYKGWCAERLMGDVDVGAIRRKKNAADETALSV